VSGLLVDRYSERKETAEELSKRCKPTSIKIAITKSHGNKITDQINELSRAELTIKRLIMLEFGARWCDIGQLLSPSIYIVNC